MKLLNTFLIFSTFALFTSCKKDFPEIPECTWDENQYQLTPFDLTYSNDFSNDFIMFTGGDINSSINHIYDLQSITKKGDANVNNNEAKIVFSQNPNSEECSIPEINPGMKWYTIHPDDVSQTNPSFYPYGKVFFHSILAPICTNAFSGETDINIQTDLFVNYKTGQGYNYYLLWSTSRLADADSGTTLSDDIPLTEIATIQYVSTPSTSAHLIANNDNGYIYIHGNRINL